MYIHNLEPVLVDLGFIAIRWYSLAYIFGILLGWWLAKNIIKTKFIVSKYKFSSIEFDDLIGYLIISMILGGRLGYIIFYNLDYYLINPSNIFKIWQGGMSFHGALIGIIIGTYFFSLKKKINTFVLLDIISCVAPVGIFLGRLANFVNAELIGKPTLMAWSVIYPQIDVQPRHPSQIYEALLEGVLLFLILNLIIYKKEYLRGFCSSLFLIIYGFFRIFGEQFREPDSQIGYLFNFLSMGSLLSVIMIGFGTILYFKVKNEH